MFTFCPFPECHAISSPVSSSLRCPTSLVQGFPLLVSVLEPLLFDILFSFFFFLFPLFGRFFFEFTFYQPFAPFFETKSFYFGTYAAYPIAGCFLYLFFSLEPFLSNPSSFFSSSSPFSSPLSSAIPHSNPLFRCFQILPIFFPFKLIVTPVVLLKPKKFSSRETFLIVSRSAPT